MTVDWPSFPVDDVTLDLIESALQGAYDVDDEGEHHWVGSEFPLYRVFEFLSGYDPELSMVDLEDSRRSVYEGHLLSERDALLAFITEIRRLRAVPPAPRRWWRLRGA